MEKQEFVAILKKYKDDLQSLSRNCQKAPGKQIQTRSLLSEVEVLAASWFENIEPTLRSTYKLSDDVITQFRDPFGKLLEIIEGRPSKQVVLTLLSVILSSYHNKLLVPIQKHEEVLARFPSLDNVLSHAVGLEVEYLNEAISCARSEWRRAAIILGWCAAVNRLHLYIQKEGFTKFNHSSIQMFSIQTGRYKRFNKKFDVQNLSDLRMTVFDGDLMWVLEFMGIIDSNQHERLGICFTMRNTSAHPGEVTVSDENVLSFFSDIDSLIFTNPKFLLEQYS
jgi:hypothetical protein